MSRGILWNDHHLGAKLDQLCSEEEYILASSARRLIDIAVVAGARGMGPSPAAALNAMQLPAVVIDRLGFVDDVNAAADAVFDNDIKIRGRRLLVNDPAARTHLKDAIDRLKDQPLDDPRWLNFLAMEPVIVPRKDKLPVIVRIWPLEGPSHAPRQDVRALLTLNALEPRPGPPAAILAKTFRLTPAEAKLASIVARGASMQCAAEELKISPETARTQLKAVFAKTDTHRQSELVALLLRVE
jgi:DNA-binding CsgD family transcriptional regulator